MAGRDFTRNYYVSEVLLIIRQRFWRDSGFVQLMKQTENQHVATAQIYQNMEPIDALRERIAKYVCGRYNLPAIVLKHGRNANVICCCREFANELRTEITKTHNNEIGNLKITFITGNVEFV